MEAGLQQTGHRRRVQTLLIALVSIFSQLSSIFPMATEKTKKKERASWCDAEIDALLDFLIEHKGEAGDGMNFKDSLFQDSLAWIAPHHVKGPKKTMKMARSKYNWVSAFGRDRDDLAEMLWYVRSEQPTMPSVAGGPCLEFTGTIRMVPMSRQRRRRPYGRLTLRSRLVSFICAEMTSDIFAESFQCRTIPKSWLAVYGKGRSTHTSGCKGS